MTTRARPRIVVLGGGFAGLESTFLLRALLKDRAQITLVSDRPYFLYKPNTIYIPFGLEPEKLMIPLDRPTRKQGIRFLNARVQEVDPESRSVSVEGESLSYDFLVVATGAGMRPEEVPGLREFALTIWTPEEMLQLRDGINRLVEKARSGQRMKVLFLVPPNNKCSGPLYEIVMMLETWLRRKGVRDSVSITWTTYEQAYIQAFGPRIHRAVESEFARRGIEGHTRYVVKEVTDRKVVYENGAEIPYDLLISFPPYVASTAYPGLPADERGFISTELSTRQVVDHPDIYAPGDTGDFPVKQAFLAFLQADAVARHIASRVMGTPFTEPFEPTSMCVMEQFDKATFAQVPLRLTGDPSAPVVVREDAWNAYKVGVSPLWRMGKWMLGLYLPWRFRNGKPFHAGAPWRAMEMGLKVMSRVLAS